MINTALRANSGCEHLGKKSHEVTYKNQSHHEFYDKYIQECRYEDVYHKALVYCLGINEDTRNHIHEIYDFRNGCVNTECLNQGWITSGSAKVIRMAFNLYCNSAPSVEDYSSIIYVKNFISADTAVEKEDQTEKSPSQDSRPGDIVDQSGFRTGSDCRLGEIIDQSENASTGSRNTSVVLGENVAPSNKEDNNIELNNTNHIYLSKDTMQEEESIDEMEKINQEALVYMDIIRGNIEYDIMMSDKHWSDREMYDELYEIICDVVCVPKKFVRIGGENYPYSLVKSKFLKLNSSHLQYVIGCVKNNTTKVSNIRAYLITALYNAPNTMGHYYTSQVNHDMFGVG